MRNLIPIPNIPESNHDNLHDSSENKKDALSGM